MSPAELIDTTIVIISGITSIYFSKQQNDIFREQNRIFAAQSGVKMRETYSKKNTLGIYWPTIAAAFTAVVVGVFVSRVQKSPIFAVTSSLIVLLAFVAVYWRERSQRMKVQETAKDLKPFLATRAQASTSKSPHNVQCLGVEAGERAAQIGFINVEIPNQDVGNFNRARLKIRYSLAHSGEEVALVFPARWIGSDEYEISIGFEPEYAVLAVYINNQWHGVETVEVLTPQSEIESYFRRELRLLPSAQLRIEATLFGKNNLSLLPFTGILTLREDGSASFQPTTE
ncbi:MAG: hypothetical protein ACYCO5_05265 [Acidobacteriaceae bacterium]